MSAAAPASPNNTFYCERLPVVFPFHLCVGATLSSSGLLICTFLVWVGIKECFFNVHKCVSYTFASIVAVLVMVSVVLLSALAIFSLYASVMVFENFSSISAYRCNLGFLVMYYWAFTEIVIMLFLFVLGVIVAIVAVFCGIVVWLT